MIKAWFNGEEESLTGRDLFVEEELSSAGEPCLEVLLQQILHLRQM